MTKKLVPIIQVLKYGLHKSLENATPDQIAYDNTKFMLKVLGVMKLNTNDSFTEWSNTNGYPNIHGLNYPPNVICFQKDVINMYDDPDTGKYIYRPVLYDVDDKNIYGYTGQVYDPNIGDYVNMEAYALVFLDPLSEPENYLVNENRINGAYIITQNENGERSYKHGTDTFYDSLKAHNTDVLVLDVPAVTLGSDPNTDGKQKCVIEYYHGLGYLPVVAPFERMDIDLNRYYQSDGTTIPTNINLNSIATSWVESAYPVFYSGLVTIESVDVWFDEKKVHLEFVRNNMTGANYTAPKRRITLGYTVFKNRLDKEFNLLNS